MEITVDHSECSARARLQRRSVVPGETAEHYWAAVRQSLPPYLHNGIHLQSVLMTKEELLAAADRVKNDPVAIAALVAHGPRKPAPRLCEWCNLPL